MDLSRVAWRKSSRSGGNGGACVEVAAVDLPSNAWRKSSRSAGNGGQCIEVASTRSVVAVRDSKNPDGAVLAFPPRQWRAFAASLKSDDLV